MTSGIPSDSVCTMAVQSQARSESLREAAPGVQQSETAYTKHAILRTHKTLFRKIKSNNEK